MGSSAEEAGDCVDAAPDEGGGAEAGDDGHWNCGVGDAAQDDGAFADQADPAEGGDVAGRRGAGASNRATAGADEDVSARETLGLLVLVYGRLLGICTRLGDGI